jgi:hypothetical protein
VFAVLPFGNRTVILTLTGAQLREALLTGFSPVCNPQVATGRFPQVSGLKLTFHCSGATPVIDELSLAPEGPGGPLTPIGPGDTVRLVTNDFMFTGGDGYTALAGASDVLTPGDGLLEVTIEYIAATRRWRRGRGPDRQGSAGLGSSRSASDRGAAIEVGFDRGVVAQAVVAPGVVVDAPNRAQLGRGEDVVETPAAVVAGAPAPGPARLASRVAVEGAKGVVVTEVSETWDDAELAGIPLRSSLDAEPSPRVARERHHAAIRQLPAGRVEVAAEDARARGRGREPAPDRLEGSDLDPAVARVRHVDAVDLNRAAAGVDQCSDLGLRPWRVEPRDGV